MNTLARIHQQNNSVGLGQRGADLDSDM